MAEHERRGLRSAHLRRGPLKQTHSNGLAENGPGRPGRDRLPLRISAKASRPATVSARRHKLFHFRPRSRAKDSVLPAKGQTISETCGRNLRILMPGFHQKVWKTTFTHRSAPLGPMSLAEAQRAIVGDWLKVYTEKAKSSEIGECQSGEIVLGLTPEPGPRSRDRIVRPNQISKTHSETLRGRQMPILSVGTLQRRPVRHSALASGCLQSGPAQGPSISCKSVLPPHTDRWHFLLVPPSGILGKPFPIPSRVRFPSFPDLIVHLKPIGVKCVNVFGLIYCGPHNRHIPGDLCVHQLGSVEASNSQPRFAAISRWTSAIREAQFQVPVMIPWLSAHLHRDNLARHQVAKISRIRRIVAETSRVREIVEPVA